MLGYFFQRKLKKYEKVICKITVNSGEEEKDHLEVKLQTGKQLYDSELN